MEMSINVLETMLRDLMNKKILLNNEIQILEGKIQKIKEEDCDHEWEYDDRYEMGVRDMSCKKCRRYRW